MAPAYRPLLVLIACIITAKTVTACLWDYDTLKMERQRFPTTLELITGKFIRHSPEFYQWRIKDRLNKLQSDPQNLPYLDDLAAAYDKVGQQQKAIDTMLAKERIKPGLYETQANLGTFYMHLGQWEKGLEHVNKALQINPNAHFGREKYQKYLAEYVVSCTSGGKLKLPLARLGEHGFSGNYALFLCSKLGTKNLDREQQQAAIKGVLGMMRFANHESPILLEALGSLLGDNTYYGTALPMEDGKQLSARAYLKASYHVEDKEAKQQYRKMAEYVLKYQTPHPNDVRALPLSDLLERDFGKELSEAAAWYASVRENELGWIKSGQNPEQEFDRLYYVEPEVTDSEPPYLLYNPWFYVILISVLLLTAIVLYVGWKVLRRSQN